MKYVRLEAIQWDTDGADPKKLRLPAEVVIAVPSRFDPAEESADLLSDIFGFCVKGCRFVALLAKEHPNAGIAIYEPPAWKKRRLKERRRKARRKTRKARLTST